MTKFKNGDSLLKNDNYELSLDRTNINDSELIDKYMRGYVWVGNHRLCLKKYDETIPRYHCYILLTYKQTNRLRTVPFDVKLANRSSISSMLQSMQTELKDLCTCMILNKHHSTVYLNCFFNCKVGLI